MASSFGSTTTIVSSARALLGRWSYVCCSARKSSSRCRVEGDQDSRGLAGAAAVLLALLLVTASVHADAAAAPARRLLGADGASGPPPPTLPVSVSKALRHCGATHDPNISCPPPAHAP
uniref:Uncharacterized protein n=1 Tax=Saccharum officinarum TaxID=4547 RepID=A0A678T4L2_SACOF|nr:hypothetical protein SO33D14_000001 [Saccharum officinarum]